VIRSVNARQLEVLRWVADGCPEGRWPDDDFTYKTTAGALKSRGLITVKGHGRTWQAAITDAGTYFLDHGGYPPGHSGGGTPGGRRPNAVAETSFGGPVELGDKAQATLDEAKELIERISASGGSITVADPSEPTRARYRRLLHACRVHHLVPPGQELRFTGRDSGDIVVAIGDGSDEGTSDWLRIRTTNRRVTANLKALRHGLDTSTILHSISEGLRPRAADVICDLAEELRKHDLKLGINVKLKTPKLFVQIDTKRRMVTIEELTKKVPHVRTPAEEREAQRHPWKSFPTTDDALTGKLRLTVRRDGWREQGDSNRDEWDDAPKRALRDQIATIAGAIKKGVIDDQDAHARAEQARAEAQERHERQRTEQQRAWEVQRQKARAKAAEQLRRVAFAHAMDDWRTAHDLRAFCGELEAVADTGDAGHLRDWIAWARQSADELDAAAQAARLNDLEFDVLVTTDDIEPYMEGWSTKGPHKASTYSTQPPRQPTVPQSSPWHPGMRGRASWWR
jgi:hypothetical protein